MSFLRKLKRKPVGTGSAVPTAAAAPALELQKTSTQQPQSIGQIPRPEEEHNRYTYEPLSGLDSIRVLGLLPAKQHSDPLWISLIECTLQPDTTEKREDDPTFNPPYEALSYVWGERQGTCPVRCDLQFLFVTPNCEAALRRLRWKDETRLLWIDAVCINQQDDVEKSLQVAKMDVIYRIAGSVVMWLGDGDGTAGDAFGYLERWYFRSLDLDKLPAFHTREQVLKKQAEDRALSTDDDEAKFGTTEAGMIYEMLSNEYFNRMWTIQEASFGTTPTLLCGDASMAWSIFSYGAIGWIAAGFKTHRRGFYGDALVYGFRSHYHCCVLAYANPGAASWKNLADTVDPIHQLIDTADTHQCQDPRDKVFALYHVFRKIGINLPPPDYTKPIHEVYRDATRAIIADAASLAIFDSTNPSADPHLPSWVHDFRVRWNNSAMASTASKDSRAKTSRLRDCESHQLPLEGYFLSDITKVGKHVGAIPDNTIQGGIERVDQFYALIELYYELNASLETPPSFENFYGALMTPIPLTGNERMSLVEFLTTVATWTEVAEVASREESPPLWVTDQVDPENMNWAFISSNKSLLKWFALAEFDEFRTLLVDLYGRYQYLRLFYTETGLFGFGPLHIQSEDILVLLAGATHPVVLRDHGTDYKFVSPVHVEGIMDSEAWPDDELNLEPGGICAGMTPPPFNTGDLLALDKLQQSVKWPWLRSGGLAEVTWSILKPFDRELLGK